MSYSSNRRAAIDLVRPLPHRISHARSCAVAVAEKYRVSRESIIALVSERCGVDLMTAKESEAIIRAIGVLDQMKLVGLTVIAEPATAPNSRLPSQLAVSPEIQPSDSQRTPSSGGCG